MSVRRHLRAVVLLAHAARDLVALDSRSHQRARAAWLLIFTTHGRQSVPHLGSPDVGEDGFWFAPLSEQDDLRPTDYGQTLVTRDFVDRALADTVAGSVALYREADWFDHQDLYVVRRDACAMR